MKYIIAVALLLVVFQPILHAQKIDPSVREKRVIIICAHPDDVEITSGGTAVLLSRLGYKLKFVSVTNGNKGYFEGTKNEIALRRYFEVQEVKKRIDCEYEILNIDDGELEANLKNRMEIIRVIREWNPDIVITHPPYDYHPDHRYTSLLVQDASFLVNVPKVMPEVPALEHPPLFLYTRGRYTNPLRAQPDIVVDITSVVREKAYLLDAHESQIYEFLPWINRSKTVIPDDDEARIRYVMNQYVIRRGQIKEHDVPIVKKWYGGKYDKVKTIEAFEICEFGRMVNDDDIHELFPMFNNVDK